MKIFIATKNMKKLTELTRILEPMGFEVVCERDLEKPLNEVEETGTTFEENAISALPMIRDFALTIQTEHPVFIRHVIRVNTAMTK